MDSAICDVQLTARHGSDTGRMCHRTHLTAIRDAILRFFEGDWPHYRPPRLGQGSPLELKVSLTTAVHGGKGNKYYLVIGASFNWGFSQGGYLYNAPPIIIRAA